MNCFFQPFPARPLTRFSRRINPVCLPSLPVEDFSGQSRVVLTIGWGITDAQQFAKELMKLPRTLLPSKTCERVLTTFNPFTMVCASDSGGRDQCGGDSGTGWVSVIKKQSSMVSRWHLVALTSWGMQCGTAPGVGARVSSEAINWIRSMTAQHSRYVG